MLQWEIFILSENPYFAGSLIGEEISKSQALKLRLKNTKSNKVKQVWLS